MFTQATDKQLVESLVRMCIPVFPSHIMKYIVTSGIPVFQPDPVLTEGVHINSKETFGDNTTALYRYVLDSEVRTEPPHTDQID